METYSINSVGKNLISHVWRNGNTWLVDVMIIKKQNTKVTVAKNYIIKTFDNLVSMEFHIYKLYEQDKDERFYCDFFIDRE